MKFFSSLWNTIKPTLLRFPAAFLLSALATVMLCTNDLVNCGWVSKSAYFALAKSAFWAFALSVFTRLLEEVLFAKFSSKKYIFLASQAVCVILAFFPGYIFSSHDSPRFYLVYFGTFLALFVLCVYMLYFSQSKEKLVANILLSLMISSTIAVCIGAGFSVIFFAFDQLICNCIGELYSIIWCTAFFFFLPCIFISYATKKDSDIVIPKSFKVIVLYVLFSLYCILLLVLYAYLIKSLVTLTLPSGKINPFVSGASLFFLFFYLSLAPYKNKLTSFFYKYAAIFLLVLIAVQLLAFAIRIHAYGFTPARCASLYYIIFSITFCILPLIQKGKYMQAIYPLFAAICIFASVTPLNIIDSASRNQYKRIVSTLKKYNLFKDGKVIPSSKENFLSLDDKKTIRSAFSELNDPEKKKLGFVRYEKEFREIFGFAVYDGYDENFSQGACYYALDVPDERSVNIQGFSELFYFKTEESDYVYDEKDWKPTVSFGDNYKIELGSELLPLLNTDRKYEGKVDSLEPLVIKKDGFTLIIREMNLKKEKYSEERWYYRYKLIGYACR